MASAPFLLDTNILLACLRGKALGKNDLWIAAAAKVSGATLLTTDPDFDILHEAKQIQRIRIDEKAGKS